MTISPHPRVAIAEEAAPVVFEAEDLRIRLHRAPPGQYLVDGVSLAVRSSESVAIVGESGAGKSVSVRGMLGLLDRARFEVTGRIRLLGRDLGELSPRESRRYVTSVASLVFQDPNNSLNPTMRVGWQIAEAMTKRGKRSERLDRDAARERSVALIRDVGIADPESRFLSFPHQLSGGMKQRVVIAIALACRPSVIFCDEPTSALDVTTQATVMDLLDDLRVTRGIAIVLITHDLALAGSRVDRVAVMHHGRVMEILPAGALATRAAMPYTRALVGSMPDSSGATMPQPISVLPGRGHALPGGCSFEPFCSRAQDACTRGVPPLESLAPGHLYRCWYPVLEADREGVGV